MGANRSAPGARVVPVLTYSDVRAAVAWLEAVAGFLERVRIGADRRAQLLPAVRERAGEGGVDVVDADLHEVPRAPAPVGRRPVAARVGDDHPAVAQLWQFTRPVRDVRRGVGRHDRGRLTRFSAGGRAPRRGRSDAPAVATGTGSPRPSPGRTC